MTVIGLGRPLMRVRLLEVDPDLARWIPATERSRAHQAVVASAFPLRAGEWTPPGGRRAQQLGFLVLTGLLARDERLQGTVARELLGPGDLISSWREGPEEKLLASSVRWRVIEQATLAILDERVERAVARYPSLSTALLHRALAQRSRLSTHKAICQLPGVDAKLLALFWHLAERWGKVTPEGVLLPLRLHHEALGQLIGARRPTVTLALQRLSQAGQIEFRADGGWTLRDNGSATSSPDVAPQHPAVLDPTRHLRIAATGA